jgi:hypothetical protein
MSDGCGRAGVYPAVQSCFRMISSIVPCVAAGVCYCGQRRWKLLRARLKRHRPSTAAAQRGGGTARRRHSPAAAQRGGGTARRRHSPAAAQRGGTARRRHRAAAGTATQARVVYRSHLASGPCRRWVRGMHRLLQHGARMVAGWPYRAVCLLAREGGHSAAAEGSVSAVASHRIAVGASFLRQTHSSRAPHGGLPLSARGSSSLYREGRRSRSSQSSSPTPVTLCCSSHTSASGASYATRTPHL